MLTVMFALLQLLDFAVALYAFSIPGMAEGLPLTSLFMSLGWPGFLLVKLVFLWAFHVIVDLPNHWILAFFVHCAVLGGSVRLVWLCHSAGAALVVAALGFAAIMASRAFASAREEEERATEELLRHLVKSGRL